MAAKIYSDCIRYYPFVLGAQPVRMIDLAAFYAAVANEGARPQPHGINSIEQNGRTIYEYPKTPLPMIGAADRAAFYQLKTILQGVVARGTARAIGALSPYVAGKTGTTEDAVDGWFIGFTNDVTVAVWVGYDNGDGKRRSLGASETGARVALPIFEPIMAAIWAEGIAPKTPLSGPSREAQRQLIDLPIDYMSGDRLNGGRGFVEHFRLGADGRFDETQYQLVSREDAYASSNPDQEWGPPEQSWGTGAGVRRVHRAPGGPIIPPGRAAAAAAVGARLVRAVVAIPTIRAIAFAAIRTISSADVSTEPRATERASNVDAARDRGGRPDRVVVRRLGAGFPHRGRGFGAATGAWRNSSPARSRSATRSAALPPARANLISFEEWGRTRPVQKKFLSLFPGYIEPTVVKTASAGASTGPVPEKLTMYVAQARFILDRPPGSIDLSRYVALPFLEKIDPAIKDKTIAAADVNPLKDQQGTGNENPDRKWCTGRATLICIQSSYKLEGKIPIGIMLVNKLRDSAKKVSDHIDFESELSALSPADVDRGRVEGVDGARYAGHRRARTEHFLRQSDHEVRQVPRRVPEPPGPTPNKTVVTAFMALAIESSVLDKKKEFEKVPVLRNLVPAQVLMGQSSFNSGDSISAGLPKYARNEIRTIANILERDK